MSILKRLVGREYDMNFELREDILWEDIEIGEVFAFMGCITIMQKDSETSAILLATDCENGGIFGEIHWNKDLGVSLNIDMFGFSKRFEEVGHAVTSASPELILHRLSKEVQALWKVE